MITQNRHQRFSSIPKEVRLQYGISKPVADQAAAFACAVAGSGLGIVFGAALADALGFAGTPSAAVADSAPAIARPAPTQPRPAELAVAFKLDAQVQVQAQAPFKKASSHAASIDQPAQLMARNTEPDRQVADQNDKPALSSQEKAIPVSEQSTQVATEVAAAAKVPQTPTFRVEGDAMVVDFDSVADTLEFRDGRTFALAGTAAQNDGSTWQDYVGNVHYACDQGGSCTISRGGNMVSSAKMIGI